MEVTVTVTSESAETPEMAFNNASEMGKKRVARMQKNKLGGEKQKKCDKKTAHANVIYLKVRAASFTSCVLPRAVSEAQIPN